MWWLWGGPIQHFSPLQQQVHGCPLFVQGMFFYSLMEKHKKPKNRPTTFAFFSRKYILDYIPYCGDGPLIITNGEISCQRCAYPAPSIDSQSPATAVLDCEPNIVVPPANSLEIISCLIYISTILKTQGCFAKTIERQRTTELTTKSWLYTCVCTVENSLWNKRRTFLTMLSGTVEVFGFNLCF